VSHECKKGAQRGQSAVASPDRDFPPFFEVFQEREYDTGIQIGQGQLNDRAMVSLAGEAQK
jgi:hypothetical protein